MNNDDDILDVKPEVIERMQKRLEDQAAADRLKSNWQPITREPTRVERINGVFYCYSAEIGILRLLHHYHKNRASHFVRAFYSPNLETWVLTLITPPLIEEMAK